MRHWEPRQTTSCSTCEHGDDEANVHVCNTCEIEHGFHTLWEPLSAGKILHHLPVVRGEPERSCRNCRGDDGSCLTCNALSNWEEDTTCKTCIHAPASQAPLSICGRCSESGNGFKSQWRSAAITEEQRALGVTPDGIDGPNTQVARAAHNLDDLSVFDLEDPKP
jgi:hypothetical protein